MGTKLREVREGLCREASKLMASPTMYVIIKLGLVSRILILILSTE